MRHLGAAAGLVLAGCLVALAHAQDYRPPSTYVEREAWQEQAEVEPPAYPSEDRLIEFQVGNVATNRYFIDGGTISVGSDGVVRYVLVVLTGGGATNVSFEGINCASREWKHYASGRSDKTWSKSRAARAEWRLIENKPINPHHAFLYRYFFCPVNNAIRNADEGRDALRRGKHPNAG